MGRHGGNSAGRERKTRAMAPALAKAKARRAQNKIVTKAFVLEEAGRLGISVHEVRNRWYREVVEIRKRNQFWSRKFVSSGSYRPY